MVSDDQQTLVQIGKCHADLGRFTEAEAVLRRAVALSDDAVGEYNLGYVLEQVGRADEAERQYERALALNPGLAAAHTNLGTALAGTRAIRRGGRRTLRRRCGSSRATPPRATTSARCCCSSGSSTRPRVQFRLALELNPDHADAHANLGSALAQQGAYDEALRQFDEALRIDPRHAAAGANRQAVARAASTGAGAPLKTSCALRSSCSRSPVCVACRQEAPA